MILLELQNGQSILFNYIILDVQFKYKEYGEDLMIEHLLI